ncbi:MAG: hypothetical protein RLZ98_3747 [Pseudomonadota bacterium]|jgi:hypothetical protein
MKVLHDNGDVVATYADDSAVLVDHSGLPHLIMPDDVVLETGDDGTHKLPTGIEAWRKIGRATVNLWKQRRQDGGFMFNGVLFQSDKLSRQNILAARMRAREAMTFGEALVIPWTAADNTEHPLDAATLVAFSDAAYEHHVGAHLAAIEVKREIDDARTIPEIEDLLQRLA